MATKDEKFIRCAYETATNSGDLELEMNVYEIGSRVGINPKGVETICRLLAQANFIKFTDASQFKLTGNGVKLAESLFQ